MPPSSANILAAMSTTDSRQLLELRLQGMQWRRVLLVVLLFGVAALFVGLFIAEGGSLTWAAVIGWVLAALFIFYGFFMWWQMATARERAQRLFQILDLDPSRIKRIYGLRIVRAGRYASMAPIAQPESENLGESRAVCVAVELVEPSRLRRVLGLHKYVARVSPPELVELLAYLRGIAPEAQGPPGRPLR